MLYKNIVPELTENISLICNKSVALKICHFSGEPFKGLEVL